MTVLEEEALVDNNANRRKRKIFPTAGDAIIIIIQLCAGLDEKEMKMKMKMNKVKLLRSDRISAMNVDRCESNQGDRPSFGCKVVLNKLLLLESYDYIRYT